MQMLGIVACVARQGTASHQAERQYIPDKGSLSPYRPTAGPGGHQEQFPMGLHERIQIYRLLAIMSALSGATSGGTIYSMTRWCV